MTKHVYVTEYGSVYRLTPRQLRRYLTANETSGLILGRNIGRNLGPVATDLTDFPEQDEIDSILASLARQEAQ